MRGTRSESVTLACDSISSAWRSRGVPRDGDWGLCCNGVRGTAQWFQRRTKHSLCGEPGMHGLAFLCVRTCRKLAYEAHNPHPSRKVAGACRSEAGRWRVVVPQCADL